MPKKLFLLVGFVLILVGAGGFLLRSKLRPAQAGLRIETNPQATVFINSTEMGSTPYEAVRSPGEVTVRLVPLAINGSLAPWETNVSLTEGIQTIVRRDFGETELQSSGEVLSFEKKAGNSASLAVVSSPDSSQVTLDGEKRGFTSLPVDSLTLGEHRIVVSQAGYKDREISVKTIGGYKLTVFAMLAQLTEQTYLEASSSASVMGEESSGSKEQVEVLDTPTGFLRVRLEPSTSASESGRVSPGKKYDLVEESKDGKWYKIEYQTGNEGWISSQYAKKPKEKQ